MFGSGRKEEKKLEAQKNASHKQITLLTTAAS
jgi:hypothetical protein